MKTLYTNGCSWTYGGGLDSPDTVEHINNLHDNIVWPAHLKKLLNCDNVINQSAGGGSNQRICRTTFEWVNSQSKETLENTIAVIQWSLNDRYEYYVPRPKDSRFYEAEPEPLLPPTMTKEQVEERGSLHAKYRSRWAKVTPHTFISQYEPNDYSVAEHVAWERYKTYTDIEGMYTWLYQLGFLHDLFTYYGVEYYYWFFCNEVFAYPQHIQDYMYNRFNFLEPARAHDGDYERIHDLENNNDPHPSATGHEQLADRLFKQINNRKVSILP